MLLKISYFLFIISNNLFYIGTSDGPLICDSVPSHFSCAIKRTPSEVRVLKLSNIVDQI